MTYPLKNLIRKNDIDKNIVEEVYILWYLLKLTYFLLNKSLQSQSKIRIEWKEKRNYKYDAPRVYVPPTMFFLSEGTHRQMKLFETPNIPTCWSRLNTLLTLTYLL